jgi:hypothetical protein
MLDTLVPSVELIIRHIGTHKVLASKLFFYMPHRFLEAPLECGIVSKNKLFLIVQAANF